MTSVGTHHVTIDLGWSKMLISHQQDYAINPALIKELRNIFHQKIELSKEPSKIINHWESLAKVSKFFDRLETWTKRNGSSYNYLIELGEDLKQLVSTEDLKAYLREYRFSHYIVDKLPT